MGGKREGGKGEREWIDGWKNEQNEKDESWNSFFISVKSA